MTIYLALALAALGNAILIAVAVWPLDQAPRADGGGFR